jgi:hypothetical protein
MFHRLHGIRVILAAGFGTLAQLLFAAVAAACSNGGGFPG